MSFVGTLISKTGLTPNILTALAPVFALIAAFFVYHGQNVLAFVFVLLASLYDVVDGAVARATNKVTLFGNYFDAAVDRYVEIIIYLGFLLRGYTLEAFLAATLSIIVSYNKARASLVTKVSNRGWPSIGERLERFIVLIVGMFLVIFWPAILGFDTISLTLYVIVFISLIGGIQRIFHVKKLLSQTK